MKVLGATLAATVLLAPGVAMAEEATFDSSIPDPTCYQPSVEVDEFGDSIYTWDLGEHGVTTSRYPAAALDAATVDADVLDRFSAGTRPDPTSPEYEDWLIAANALLRPPTKAPGAMCAVPMTAGFASTNYSGFAALANVGQVIDGVSTSYTAPTVNPSACNNSSIGQWVGVADDTSPMRKLIQVGLGYVPSLGMMGGFYEVVGGTWDTGGAVTFGVDFIPGHRYYMHIYYASATAWRYSLVDLDDPTNAKSGSTPPHSAGGTQYRGSVGLFISELPSVLGVRFPSYMVHGDTRFRNALVELVDGSTAKLSELNPVDYVMLGDVISYTRGYADTLNVSASSFTEHWVNC